MPMDLDTWMEITNNIDWVKFGSLAILTMNVLYFLWNRWRACYLHSNPSVMAREQLYGYLLGLLGNSRAWYKDGDATIAFDIDTNANAAANSTTGKPTIPAPPQKIKVCYDGKDAAVYMANGQDVIDTLTWWEKWTITAMANHIGNELDEIATAQSILSQIPASNRA